MLDYLQMKAEEAEQQLEQIKLAKAEMLLRFAEVTDPLNLDSRTYRDAKNGLMDVLSDAFHSAEKKCEEVIGLFENAEQRQHERFESLGRA